MSIVHYKAMELNFLENLYQEHRNMRAMPSPDEICGMVNRILKILFPELSDRQYDSFRAFEHQYRETRLEVFNILKAIQNDLVATPERTEQAFFEALPTIHKRLISDAKAISSGDPAALGWQEVIRTYPGFYALAIYRIAHQFYQQKVPLLPRVLTEYAHGKTGIDIHPAAQIGDDFCIDHGTGIVIGATTVIGNNVKIYQGVTLGALSVEKKMASLKRHPTIEDGVVIYSGATILGGDTVIGRDSIIGGNVWIIKSVPPRSRVYYDNSKVQVERRELANDELL